MPIHPWWRAPTVCSKSGADRRGLMLSSQESIRCGAWFAPNHIGNIIHVAGESDLFAWR